MTQANNKSTSVLNRDADGTLTLTITIPSEQVRKAREESIKNIAQNAKLPGFRPGKAPQKMVEESINEDNLREEILKKLLPQAYVEAVKEHNLNPIMNPKIHVHKIEENPSTDGWEFTAITCEVPSVTLGDYKNAVKDITAKSKIVIPGKEKKEPNFEEIVAAVLKHAQLTIPHILIESEVERLLSQLLSEVKTLGLSLDQYLASTKKTVDELRDEYKQKAENDIKLEFVLQKIAETEKITVEPKEIDEALQKAKDDKEKKQLESNLYLLAAIIKQQKTLDFLKNL